MWRHRRSLTLPLSVVTALSLLLAGCNSDVQTPREAPGDTETEPVTPVAAGLNEYNLIDRTDPNGGPPCVVTNLCHRLINSAWWEFPADANVGTGNLNPFWDTHETGESECANTDFDRPGQGLFLNCARSSWTNALPLNLIPIFFFDPPGGPLPLLVRELVWDMNEPNSSAQTAQVSIDFFRVYLCEGEEYEDFDSLNDLLGCDRVYDIEVGGISSGTEGTGLAWDGSTQGSGSALDYRILIPESLFAAANEVGVDSCPYDPEGDPCGLYVVVHAKLGGKGKVGNTLDVNWITSGGFEEMSTVDRPVPARKSGMKFHDLDADGVKDAGEPGLPGWTIFVDMDDDGALDAGEPSDVTGADGTYEINAIPEGTWKVKELPQAGWICSFPAAAPNCYYEETFEDGEEYTGNDFGNWRPATKAGMKFHDLDADGTKDAGEGGLENWRIYVDYDDDGVHDAGEPFDDTDASGNYLITGINPGTYKVREVAQTGWTCSFPSPNCYHTETFQSGDELTNNNFGNWTPATKAGQKFHDLDADGTKDAGEGGLSGWRIYVDYDDDGVHDAGEPFDDTDASGNYLITGINPGTYKVREVAQTGWTCSFPSPNCYHNETFESDDELTGNDFGNWTPATKAGQKFHDLDGDGTKDAGEGGLSGWRIYVDYDDDGVHDAGEPFDDTDASGNYLIEGINPGTYKVREVAQTGWTCTFPSPNCYHNETFESDDDLTGNDFGNSTTATKAGQKFHDLDADGVKDAGEGGLSGWTIYVDYDDDGVLDAGEPNDVTDGSGNYLITGITPGTYKVREVAQAGWTCSFPSPNCYHNETFQSGDELTGNDFGNWTPATKAGQKFHDLDADGVKDAGEGGLSGWTIYVDYDDNGFLDAGEPSDVTDGSGNYLIEGIDPGTYKVREVGQIGWTCSFPSPNCYHNETFDSNDDLTGNDFGNWAPAEKSGMKFSDLNNNGALDGGEPGLGGWTIYVDYDNDGVLDAGEPSAVTAGDGSYTITNINPGTWRVREVGQAGWTCTFPATVDAFGCYHEETFQSDGEYPNNNFGNHIPVAEEETAYARGVAGATCFTTLNISNNWGWGISANVDNLSLEYLIWAGAAQCITSNGTLVGTLVVSKVGGKIRFTYNLLGGFTLESIHVYINTTGVWPSPVAPGQFPYKSDTANFVDTINEPDAGTTIYFIAHAIVSGTF